MFWFATVGNVLAILLSLAFWKTLADRDTPLLLASPAAWRLRFALGTAVLVGLVPLLWWLLHHLGDTAWGFRACARWWPWAWWC